MMSTIHKCSLPSGLLLLLLLSLACCKPGPAVVLSVSPLPAATEALQVMVVLGDENPQVAQEVPEFFTKAAGQENFTVGIRLPEGSNGVTRFAVAAVNQTDGCLLALGLSPQTRVNATTNVDRPAEAEVTLVPLPVPDCGQGLKLPRLLKLSSGSRSASKAGEEIIGSQGNELVVGGWGFRPEMQLSVGGQPLAAAKWVSPLEISGQIPSLRGTIGPVDISVTSAAGGSTDTNSAFLRYVHQPTFSMAAYPIPNSQAYAGAVPVAPKLIDLDGKEGLDLIFIPYYKPAPTKLNISLRSSNGSYKAWQQYDMPIYISWILPADYRGNGTIDVVLIGNSALNGVYYRMVNQSDGTFIGPGTGQSIFPTMDKQFSEVRVGQFGGDNKADLLVYLIDKTFHQVTTGASGFSTPTPVTSLPGNVTLNDLAVADLNNDGYTDFVITSVAGANPPSIDVYRNNQATGTGFMPPLHYNAPFTYISLFDINGDMLPDIVAKEGVLLNQGGGVFAPEPAPAYQLAEMPRQGGNLNGDGAVDLLFSSGSLGVKTSAQLPSWLFQAASGDPDASQMHVSADLNADGYMDVVAFGGYTALVFTNTTGSP